MNRKEELLDFGSFSLIVFISWFIGVISYADFSYRQTLYIKIVGVK